MIFHIGKPWYEGTSAKWESLPPRAGVSVLSACDFHRFSTCGGSIDRIKNLHDRDAFLRLDEERLVITDRIHKQMECARHRLCRVHLAVEVPACNVIIVFDVIGVAFIQIILIHAAFVAEQTDCLEFVLLDVACP